MKFLDTNPPEVTAEDAGRFLSEAYGLAGHAADVYSDRDRNFMVTAEDGSGFILKVFNAGEDPAVVDFQVEALRHIERVDPGLGVPRVVPATGDAAVADMEAPGGQRHLACLITALPGVLLDEVEKIQALRLDLGRTVARMDRALRGFFHPAAGQDLVWDIKQAPRLRAHLEQIDDAVARRNAEAVFARFESHLQPRLATLRAQVIHNDVTSVNTMVDAATRDRITGIFDFGDMLHGTLAAEVATALADAMMEAGDPLEAMGQLLAGYDEVLPLEEAEVDLLYDLVLTRHANCGTILAWRRATEDDPGNYLAGYETPVFDALDRLMVIGRLAACRHLREACRFPEGKAFSGAPGPEDLADGAAFAEEPPRLLEGRRKSFLGGHGLFYDQPLHLVAGEGVWLQDARGRSYLDAYNNVPHVGHANPHVVNAVCRQAARLNTNTRYLYRNLTDYAERLAATLPGDLSVAVMLSSASEANDLAWRMACAASGNAGAIVMADAYHGVTEAIDALSPAEQPAGKALRPWVRTIAPPNLYRCPFPGSEAEVAEAYLAELEAAIASLAEDGMAPAALMVDTALTSSGVLDMPAGYLAGAFARVRAAGGLAIADEVQIGFGRSGSHFWRFESYDALPDIVTMGKPIGNGFPLSAVVTTPAIAQAFKETSYFFSSVGGNPVSCAAGLAVLDCLERDGLQENARRVGGYLKAGLEDLAAGHAAIGEVRGRGLLLAVEFVADRAGKAPDARLTRRIVNRMAEDGVMVGTEGTRGNIIKVRPPMVFGESHADILLAAFARALDAG